MVIGGIILLLLALILFRYLKHALLWKGFPGFSPFKSLPMVGHAYLFRRNKLEKVLEECRFAQFIKRNGG